MTDRCDRTDLEPFARIPAGNVLRALRSVLRLSQRDLADLTRLSRSTVDRIEAGGLEPRLGQLQALIDPAGWRLGVWDPTARLPTALAEVAQPWRDGADRHYPAHLDLIIDPQPGQWWGDRFGFQSPPETFKVDWAARELRRAQSQWDLARGPYKGRPNLPRPSRGPAPPRPPLGRMGTSSAQAPE